MQHAKHFASAKVNHNANISLSSMQVLWALGSTETLRFRRRIRSVNTVGKGTTRKPSIERKEQT